jgi:hypothetical protein
MVVPGDLSKLAFVFSLGMLVPVNAYLWGFVIAAIIRWRRREKIDHVESG